MRDDRNNGANTAPRPGDFGEPLHRHRESPLKRGKVTKSSRRQKAQRPADRYLGKDRA